MNTGPEYVERLGVPLRWWAQGTMLVATLWLTVVVAVPGPTAWVVTAVALALLGLALWGYGDARITVRDGWFQAGRARIEAHHLGAVAALDAEQTRLVAGRDADARAFLLLRPYLKRAVKVEIADPADPTPYWLVSSRHPQALADALAALPRAH
ncbi:DUF3093 domain-containing protein [Nocardioides stalactiti]|uniref:DUF3093 domain-containing protein n=1 Tax=Nocardioides stalactiti TaxID=2755356 RepID=UPI0016013B83|nr:DUF3093 domain-containing protein [Nocardioides stalactiti]